MPDLASMTLPATPDSVRTARRFVEERVREWPPEAAGDALLLTSEVCTNCVVHARTDYVLRVQVDTGAVRVEVADDDPEHPAVAPDGRGLQIVDELAAAWGVDRSPSGEGKVVWFEVQAPGGQAARA